MAKNTEKYPPKLSELFDAERDLLVAKLGAARAIISSHHGELGSSLESVACDFLRSFLPHEYGIGRGFVAWREPCAKEDATWSWDEGDNAQHFRLAISTQLDIIIYDAVRGGPIADLGTSQLYPIEDVYGYVEVKTVFSDKLSNTLSVSKRLRENAIGIFSGRPEAFRETMSDGEWQIIEGIVQNSGGGANRALQGILSRPRLSCWMMAFEYERSDEGEPAKQVTRTDRQVQDSFERAWKRVGDFAHIAGALIVDMKTVERTGAAFLRSIPDTTQKIHFKTLLARAGAIGKFKETLLTELSVFERRSVGLAIHYPGYWPDGGA